MEYHVQDVQVQLVVHVLIEQIMGILEHHVIIVHHKMVLDIVKYV